MRVTPPPTPPRRDRPGRSDRDGMTSESSPAAVPKLLLGRYFGAYAEESDAGGDDRGSSVGSEAGRSPGAGAGGVHHQHQGRGHGHQAEAGSALAAWKDRAMRVEAAAAATRPVGGVGWKKNGERDTKVRQIVLGFLRETEEEEREAGGGGGGGRRRWGSSRKKGDSGGGSGGDGGGLLARLQAKGRQLAVMRYSLEEEEERNAELVGRIEEMARTLDGKEQELVAAREEARIEAARARAFADAAAQEVKLAREEAERERKVAEEVRREAEEELLGERGRRSLVEIECAKLKEEVASLSEGCRGDRGEVDALDVELDGAVRSAAHSLLSSSTLPVRHSHGVPYCPLHMLQCVYMCIYCDCIGMHHT